VISGTAIGTWRHEPIDEQTERMIGRWHWEQFVVDLPYRHDLPTIEQTSRERDHWLAEETLARDANDAMRLRACRAQVEQRTRQLNRLHHLAPGHSYPLTAHVGCVGDAIWVFVPGELYQVFQTTLRERCAPRPVFVTTLTNDWQPGYIPPASTFGYEIYQEVIAATGPGASEILLESISRKLQHLMTNDFA
jgi:hypothetical protein